MNAIVVSDTSPLRALQALELVPVLGPLYNRVLIPPAVADELAMPVPFLGPLDPAGYPFIAIQSPAETDLLGRLRLDLDEGEAQALALASEVHAEFVLIDERPARRVADRLGLRTAGVLAVCCARRPMAW